MFKIVHFIERTISPSEIRYIMPNKQPLRVVKSEFGRIYIVPPILFRLIPIGVCWETKIPHFGE